MWRLLTATATLAVALVAPIHVVAREAPATEKPLSEQIVNSFNRVFGVHPGARATHAKGVVLERTFTPTASATSVSKAVHFQQKETSVSVAVRSSASTGLPAIPDTDPGASPRGMALKFHLPNGSQTDIVVNSFNGFPVATAAELRDLFLEIGATKPGDPHPTAVDTFLSTHPTAKASLEAPKPAPVSYATLAYFGVNAFKFTNAKEGVTFGRYQPQPVAGEHSLTKEQVSTMGPDYLTDAIRERTHGGPINFKLLVQVAEQGDKIDDPSIAWPDTPKKVELGTITIAKAVADSQAAEKKLLFVPGAVVAGIEAGDPMVGVRSAAYIVSSSRRAHAQ